MRYMLLIYDNETEFGKLPETEVKQWMDEYGKLTSSLQKAGSYLARNRLRPVGTATTVRVVVGRHA